MIVLGVTGAIGSGKSTVCRMLAGMGAPVIDADLEAHRAYRRGTRAYKKIVATFGEGVLDSKRDIDRAVLGSLVFSTPEALNHLNGIVHPATRLRVERGIRRLSHAGHSCVVLEATLLIDAGWRDMVDRLWVVAAPDDAAATCPASNLRLRSETRCQRRRCGINEP